MKKSRAFSLMEVIVSVFILFLVLIPSIKLNSQQLKTYSKIRAKEKELHFFNSLGNYIKSKSISNSHLEFNNYSDFLNSFSDFQTYARNIQNDEFNLTIDVEDIAIEHRTLLYDYEKIKVTKAEPDYAGRMIITIDEELRVTSGELPFIFDTYAGLSRRIEVVRGHSRDRVTPGPADERELLPGLVKNRAEFHNRGRERRKGPRGVRHEGRNVRRSGVLRGHGAVIRGS